MKKLFIIAALLLSAAALPAEDVVLVDEPVIYPDSRQNREYIETALTEAAYYIEKMYGGKILLAGERLEQAGYDGAGANKRSGSYILKVNAVNSEDSRVITLGLERTSGGGEAEPVSFFGDWEPGAGADFGRTVFYLWGSIQDASVFPGIDPPVYVDEFAAGLIPPARLPVQGLQVYPYSLAITREGTLLVGGNSLALELDRYFRILDFPGKTLVEQGNYSYAFAVETTPGGTVFFMPSTGGEIFAFIPGAERPKRIRTAISGAAGLAVLPDGRPFVVDSSQKRAVLFGERTRKEFDIFMSEYSYITAVTAGPGGNIWIKDTMDKHIRIYSPEGDLVDSLMPSAGANELSGTRGMAVFQNGDFVLLSPQGLSRFKRNGEPLWSLDSIPGPEGGSFSTVMDVAVDSSTGLIYLSDYTGRRVIKLLDRVYARQKDADVDFENELITLNTLLIDDPYDQDALIRKAELYEVNGAAEAAMAGWERVLESDPFNREAEQKLAASELDILRTGARRMKEKTLELLNTLGPESARKSFSETVQLYEQILYRAPEDTESAAELGELKEQFELRQSPGRRRFPPLKVVSSDIDRLFPSLLHYYTRNSAGTVRILNPSETAARQVRAEVLVKNFMDFPSASSTLELIPAGEEAVLELPLRFNREIFALEEDLPIQIKITLVYTFDGEEQETSVYTGATLYRRTALSWDNSEKLAAFVTPNEEVISQFAHRAAAAAAADGGTAEQFRLSRVFLRGAAVCDALGVYGIEYIEDPASPITSVLENSDAVDTVRFPRTTLYYRSGDCDDSTALLSSLLESAGVNTAIMTSPGHVFLAFDTGEPVSNAWQFAADELEVIEHGGSVWVPLEATVVNRGFFAAWKSASGTLRQYSEDGEIEFLPVREAWKTYPSLPLPESPFAVVEPPPSRIAAGYGKSLAAMKEVLYTRVAEGLENKLSGESGRNRSKYLNMLGILHARFGETEKAKERFHQALACDSRSISAYINLANLLLLEGDPAGAISYLEKGRSVRPGSVMLNLLSAKAYHAGGDRTKAGEYYEAVADQSPQLAESISYLQKTDVSGARASDAAGEEGLFWNISE